MSGVGTIILDVSVVGLGRLDIENLYKQYELKLKGVVIADGDEQTEGVGGYRVCESKKPLGTTQGYLLKQ